MVMWWAGGTAAMGFDNGTRRKREQAVRARESVAEYFTLIRTGATKSTANNGE